MSGSVEISKMKTAKSAKELLFIKRTIALPLSHTIEHKIGELGFSLSLTIEP